MSIPCFCQVFLVHRQSEICCFPFMPLFPSHSPLTSSEPLPDGSWPELISSAICTHGCPLFFYFSSPWRHQISLTPCFPERHFYSLPSNNRSSVAGDGRSSRTSELPGWISSHSIVLALAWPRGCCCLLPQQWECCSLSERRELRCILRPVMGPTQYFGLDLCKMAACIWFFPLFSLLDCK